MKRLIILFAAFFIWTGVFSQECNQTFTGEGTFYRYGGGGNCSYPTPESPAYTGAMNELQYETSMTCGACVEVTGTKGSVIIRIEDRCPECLYGDIDLNEEAFPLIDDKIKGRVPISWKFVPCPVQGAVKFYFKEGSGQWWTAVQVRNHKYPVTKLEYLVDGKWINVPRKMFNYFVVEHPGMGTGPFDFRITDMYGHVIEERKIPFLIETEINGQNQFPNCDGSSIVSVTGVGLSVDSLTITAGLTAQLTATVSPSDATNKTVSWISENENVATVDQSGMVSGVSAGNTNIKVTTIDGGFTASVYIAVVDKDSGGTFCNNPVLVALPYSQDGAGKYCIMTSQSIGYINSWDMEVVEVNGVDFTNIWSNKLPATINGYYNIFYKGFYEWSHFEASGLKKADLPDNTITLCPNPFSSFVNIHMDQPELVESISVFDQLGKDVLVLDKSQISSSFRIGQGFNSGLYILKIRTIEGVQSLILNKTN